MTPAVTGAAPAVGDWVLVWGQVVAADRPHPDEVAVMFETHNENFTAGICKDHIVETDLLPPNVALCPALFAFNRGGPEPERVYVQCVRHHHHAGTHRDSEGVPYPETQVRGYMEEC